MTENEMNNTGQELEKIQPTNGEDKTGNEYMNDFKAQAQNYGQQFQDAAMKAKDFATEKFAVAGGKFKELQNKEPKELVEDAKEFARQKPGQALLVSAAVGLVMGLLFRGRR